MELSRNGLYACATREEELAGDKRFKEALKRMRKATERYHRLMDLRAEEEKKARKQRIMNALIRLQRAMLLRK